MNKYIFSGILIVSLFNQVQAQSGEDALRYSQTQFGGTSRIQGIAGAQQALGGDISSFSGNIAGLGFYRGSDFSISLQQNFNTSKSYYLGSSLEDQKDNFSVNQLGLVFAQTFNDYSGNEQTNGWSSIAFGLGINRVNNFNNNFSIRGRNTESSYTGYLAEYANQETQNATEAELYQEQHEGTPYYNAYLNYLINPNSDSSFYLPASNGNVNQFESRKESGGQTEWTLGFGANYSHKLYLGAGITFDNIRYIRKSDFREYDITDDTLNKVTSMNYKDNLVVIGTGTNVKFGLIYRPLDFIRLGASIQSPTYYGLAESFEFSLSSTNSVKDTSGSTVYNSEYSIRSPFKYSGGIALFFQKYGFISADIERVDYSSAKLSTNFGGDYDANRNSEIKNTYSNATNYRIGAEGKIGDLSLRIGYALYSGAYANNNPDKSRKFYTAGIGYRFEQYYIDAAFITSSYNSYYTPYTINGSGPLAAIVNDRSTVMLTVGSRF